MLLSNQVFLIFVKFEGVAFYIACFLVSFPSQIRLRNASIFCEKHPTSAQLPSRCVVHFPVIFTGLLFQRNRVSFVIAQSCILFFS